MLARLFGPKAKAVSALIGQALTIVVAYYGSDNRWVMLAVALAAVLGVYAVPNGQRPARPGAPAQAVPGPASGLKVLPLGDAGQAGPGVHDQ